MAETPVAQVAICLRNIEVAAGSRPWTEQRWGVSNREIRRILLGQAVLGLITAAIVFAFWGGFTAVAALFGAAVAVLSSFTLSVSVQRASAQAASEPGKAARCLFLLGFIERLILVVVMLALAMGWLQLNPLPLIAGFAVAQFAYGLGAFGALRHKGLQ